MPVIGTDSQKAPHTVVVLDGVGRRLPDKTVVPSRAEAAQAEPMRIAAAGSLP